MSNPETLATTTCEQHLTLPQLRTVCRLRGFPVPAGSKDDLVAAVAARMLSTAGVESAMASLTEDWLVVLHAVALAAESQRLFNLLPVIHPGRKLWDIDPRRSLGLLAENLLNRGVLLVSGREPYRSRGRSRYEEIRFTLPEDFRPMLPSFPAPTAPMRAAPAAELSASARGALARAAGAREAAGGLVERVAAAIRFPDRILSLDGRPLATTRALLGKFRDTWLDPGGPGGAGRRFARQAAAHVLSVLPAGHGITPEELARAAARVGYPTDPADLDDFLRTGVEAGLAEEDPAASAPRFRARPAPSPDDGSTLALEAAPGGVLVDPRNSGLSSLVALSRLSFAEPRGGRILLSPDPVRLGRAAGELDRIPAVAQAAAASAVFRKAVANVRARAGRTLVHTGLSVLRIDDPMLALSLSRRFNEAIRPLGGPWYAALTGALPGIEGAAEKEGFRARRPEPGRAQ